jgi:hypothetical protein
MRCTGSPSAVANVVRRTSWRVTTALMLSSNARRCIGPGISIAAAST